MNKLHLEYQRETGNTPTKDMYLSYIKDSKINDPEGIINEWLNGLEVDTIHTPEYIEWLESKLNSL